MQHVPQAGEGGRAARRLPGGVGHADTFSSRSSLTWAARAGSALGGQGQHDTRALQRLFAVRVRSRAQLSLSSLGVRGQAPKRGQRSHRRQHLDQNGPFDAWMLAISRKRLTGQEPVGASVGSASRHDHRGVCGGGCVKRFANRRGCSIVGRTFRWKSSAGVEALHDVAGSSVKAWARQ